MNLASGRPTPLLGALGAAAGVSAALIWLVSGDLITVLAFAGGLAVLLAAWLVIARMRSPAAAEGLASPDWSVTVSAIERPGEAVAIFLWD